MNQQCRKTRSLFGPYIDGDLGPKALQKMDAHLEACPECRAELKAEQQVADVFSGLPEMSCPKRVNQRITMRLADEPKQLPLSHRLGLLIGSPGWKTVTACAAALVVVMLFLPLAPEDQDGVDTVLNTSGDDRISHQEAYQARQRAKTSLAYVAQLLQDTERETVNEILTKKIPKALKESLQRVVPVSTGGSDS
jgi:hypothetical protein